MHSKGLKELLQKYQNLSNPIKASIWFAICNMLQRGISLISTPIFTRLLTTDEYGVFTVYQSWYNIIAVFATLNLYCGVFNNGLMKFSANKAKFVSSMQGLSTTATVVLFLVYACNMDFWNSLFGLSSLFVMLIFVELLFVPAYQFWGVQQRYEFKYKSLVIVTLAMTIASPVIGVIAVLSTTYKAEARVLSYVLIQVFIGLVLYVYNMIRGKTFFSKEYWKFALGFNIPLIPHYLSQIILQQSDRIMINSMVGTGASAIYGVAYTIGMLMQMITNAIVSSYTPYSYQKLEAKDYYSIRKTANSLLLFVGVCCLMVVVVGPEVVALIAPSEYADAMWIIPPVSISVYFMFMYNLFSGVEFFFELTKFSMIASCSAAGVNVVLNYIFIKLYGYIAAGYTTLVCYLLYALAHGILCQWVARKKTDCKEIYDNKAIIVFSLVIIGLMIGITFLYRYTIVRWLLVAAAVILAFVKRRDLVAFAKSMQKR